MKCVQKILHSPNRFLSAVVKLIWRKCSKKQPETLLFFHFSCEGCWFGSVQLLSSVGQCAILTDDRKTSFARQNVHCEIAFFPLRTDLNKCEGGLLFRQVFTWLWALEFSIKSTMLALKLPARAVFNLGVFFDLRGPSAKHFPPMFFISFPFAHFVTSTEFFLKSTVISAPWQLAGQFLLIQVEKPTCEAHFSWEISQKFLLHGFPAETTWIVWEFYF